MVIDRKIPLILGAIALLYVGCDRTPAQRQTRAGTAIGLETRQTAAGIAESLAHEADPACGVYVIEGPMTVATHWIVEGERNGEIVLELDETRRLEVDSSDRVRYLRTVDFRSEHGREDEREREWRLLDDHLYTRELNLPFESRQADVADRDALLDEPRQVFETLVQSTRNRWGRADRLEAGWRLETTEGLEQGHGVSCGRIASDDPWLSHLLARAQVTEGVARVDVDPTTHKTVSRTGSWTIEPTRPDTYRLRIAVEETITRGTSGEPIEAPAEVYDSTRPRPYATLEAFLRDLDAELSTDASESQFESPPLPLGEGRGEGTR